MDASDLSASQERIRSRHFRRLKASCAVRYASHSFGSGVQGWFELVLALASPPPDAASAAVSHGSAGGPGGGRMAVGGSIC
eukprot:287372-Hanusia_phi.AAC.5